MNKLQTFSLRSTSIALKNVSARLYLKPSCPDLLGPFKKANFLRCADFAFRKFSFRQYSDLSPHDVDGRAHVSFENKTVVIVLCCTRYAALKVSQCMRGSLIHLSGLVSSNTMLKGQSSVGTSD